MGPFPLPAQSCPRGIPRGHRTGRGEGLPERRLMEVLGRKLPMSTSLILWAVLWEIVGQLDLVSLIPPLSNVLVRLAEIVPTESFLEALALTARAFLAGTAIATVVGVPVGVLMGRS